MRFWRDSQSVKISVRIRAILIKIDVTNVAYNETRSV